MKPEMTQGGGFAGGVFTGPAARPQGNALFDLAEAIGAGGRALVGGLVDDHGQRIETLKLDASKEAEIFEQTTAGYTSEMLNAELESEPMAQRFKENPYLLPAINVYRGRKLADELGLRMVEEGIDTGDAESVRAWYQTNAPNLDDPFFARGFNEQNARLQAQFNQQQLKEALQKAEDDRIAGAGEIWREVFFATGDVNAAKAAVDESVFGKSLSGRELAGIQFEFAKQLAVEGNLEMLDALVFTRRGDAPSLAEDARYAGDVATLLDQARLKRTQDEAGFRNANQIALRERINAGISRAALEGSKEFAALARPGQKEGAYSQEQYEVLAAHLVKQESLREEYKRLEAVTRMEAAIAGAEARAASLLEAGAGYMIEDFEYVDPVTGKGKKVSASALRNGSINFLRSQALGPEPFSLQGEDAKRYRLYTDALSASGETDDRLKRALAGMASSLTPEGLADNPEAAIQAYTIFSNLSPGSRSRYVPNARTRAILENTSSIIGDNPRIEPLVALRRATAVADSPIRLGPASVPVKNVIEDIRLVDPQGERSFFGIAGPRKKFAPDSAQLREFVSSRMTEYRTFGMTDEAASEAAAREAADMFVAVNGVAVRLPEKPMASGIAPGPEQWARDVLQFVDNFASASDIPSEELRVIWNNENNYSVVRQVEGAEPELMGYVSAADIHIDATETRKAAMGVLRATSSKPKPQSPEETIGRVREEERDRLERLTRMTGNMK